MHRRRFSLKEYGTKFGRLTLTGHTFRKLFPDGWWRLMYEGVCECGDVRGYQAKYLMNGTTKSCGCLRKDMISKAVVHHNLTHHPLYHVYQDMVRRCTVEKCKAYQNYGGRGIAICEEWLNDIRSFVNWGMANGFERGLELDRINNDGHYEPANCRFVTREVGNANTRRNVLLTAFGETKTMTEWSKDKRCKTGFGGLKERIKTGKWDVEKAITTPTKKLRKEVQRNSKSARQVTAFGETKSIIAWSEDKRCTIGYITLKARLLKGWTPEQAIKSKLRTYINKKEKPKKESRLRMYKAFGETKCMTDWAKDERCKVTFGGLRSRIDFYGWTDFEKAMTTPSYGRYPKMEGASVKERLIKLWEAKNSK